MPKRFLTARPREFGIFSLPSALLVSALLYAWTLTYPISIDSSLYAYMAAGVLKGYWPYVNAVENNFPGVTFFVHLPELLLFGRSVVAFHAWDVLWQLAGAFFLYRIIERSYGQCSAWLAVVLVAIFYVSLDTVMVAQRDCFATVILLATIYALGTVPTIRRAISSGVLYGIAILIRPTNEALALVLAAQILYEERTKLGLRKAIVFLACAQSWLVVLVVVSLAAGALANVYTILILFNLGVYSHPLPLRQIMYPFAHYWFLLPGVPIGLYAFRTRDRLLFSGLMLASLATLVPQTRNLYQYDTVLVLMFATAALGYAWLVEQSRSLFAGRCGSAVRVGLIGAIALVSLAELTRGTPEKRIFFEWLEARLPAGPVYWQYDTSSASGYAVLDQVGAYLKAHTRASERVQFIGEYVYPLYDADRISATRFILMAELEMRGPKGLTSYQMRWREEFVDSIRADPPLYIVVPDAPDYARGYLNGLLGHEILERDLTHVGEVVRSQYHFETRIGAFTFYRRN